MDTVPLTKAKARLSGLVQRLIHRRTEIVITKHGKPVAALVPFEDWARLKQGQAGKGLASVAPPREEMDDDIDAMVDEIYRARRESKDREPRL